MVEMDYQRIAERAEELYMQLLRHQSMLIGTTGGADDTMAIIPDVNACLHEEYPDFMGVFKLIRAASRSDLGYPWWHFTFELQENGRRIGSQWETTYEKSDRLSPFEQAMFEDVYQRS